MSNTAPEEMVYTLLKAVTSVAVYKGPVSEASDAGIFCLATGGRAPESFFNQDAQQLKFKGVQVRVRSDKFQFKAGRDLTRLVWDTLKNANPQDGSSSG